MFEPDIYRELIDAKKAVFDIENPTKRFNAMFDIDAAIHRYNTSRHWWNRRIKYIGEN